MKTIKEINKKIWTILQEQFVDKDKDGEWGTKETANKITQQILSLIEELEGKMPKKKRDDTAYAKGIIKGRGQEKVKIIREIVQYSDISFKATEDLIKIIRKL